MARKFSVIIEQDEDGVYVGKVPELRGCLSQGDTIDELLENVKEAVELCLEVEAESKSSEGHIKFIGVQQIEVA
jgi:predicted RNase H-like HicB family nuclease